MVFRKMNFDLLGCFRHELTWSFSCRSLKSVTCGRLVYKKSIFFGAGPFILDVAKGFTSTVEV
jgi:hypothetical protein